MQLDRLKMLRTNETHSGIQNLKQQFYISGELYHTEYMEKAVVVSCNLETNKERVAIMCLVS